MNRNPADVDIIKKIVSSVFMPMKMWQHFAAIVCSLGFFFFLNIYYVTMVPVRDVDYLKGWALLSSVFFYKLFEYLFCRKMVLKGIKVKGTWAFVEFMLMAALVVVAGFIATGFWL